MVFVSEITQICGDFEVPPNLRRLFLLGHLANLICRSPKKNVGVAAGKAMNARAKKWPASDCAANKAQFFVQ
jgi:hypothetical protein